MFTEERWFTDITKDGKWIGVFHTFRVNGSRPKRLWEPVIAEYAQQLVKDGYLNTIVRDILEKREQVLKRSNAQLRR